MAGVRADSSHRVTAQPLVNPDSRTWAPLWYARSEALPQGQEHAVTGRELKGTHFVIVPERREPPGDYLNAET